LLCANAAIRSNPQYFLTLVGEKKQSKIALRQHKQCKYSYSKQLLAIPVRSSQIYRIDILTTGSEHPEDINESTVQMRTTELADGWSVLIAPDISVDVVAHLANFLTIDSSQQDAVKDGD
jgi:hypothetical protein